VRLMDPVTKRTPCAELAKLMRLLKKKYKVYVVYHHEDEHVYFWTCGHRCSADVRDDVSLGRRLVLNCQSVDASPENVPARYWHAVNCHPGWEDSISEFLDGGLSELRRSVEGLLRHHGFYVEHVLSTNTLMVTSHRVGKIMRFNVFLTDTIIALAIVPYTGVIWEAGLSDPDCFDQLIKRLRS
jgi:hypothetical protein